MRKILLSGKIIVALSVFSGCTFSMSANDKADNTRIAHRQLTQRRTAEEAPVRNFRYTKETVQSPSGSEWKTETYNDFKYDRFGHMVEQKTHSENSEQTARLQNIYDENGMIVSQISSYAEEEGQEYIPETKVECVYDNIDPSFPLEKNLYLWHNEAWAKLTGSTRSKIERDKDNNVLSIVTEEAKMEGWEETTRTFYTYENGKAVTMKYYTYENGEWYLDLDATKLVWDRTDGQLTGLLGDYLQGANRLLSGTLNYQGDPMNNFVIKYGENDVDYEMTLKYPDGEWAETDTYRLLDNYGSRVTEMIYETVNGKKEISGVELKYDKFGNEIRYRKYDGMEGNVHDSTREINDYTYNTTTGLPESSILSVYNSDNDTMVPAARSIYSDYIDIAGVETNRFDTTPSLRYVSGIIYTDGQICRIYNASGALVAESCDEMIDTRNLAEGIYIARTADKSLKFRK